MKIIYISLILFDLLILYHFLNHRTTEKLLENFRYQLAEINNSIKDHAEQINNTTMNIIQNEEKISKLISTF